MAPMVGRNASRCQGEQFPPAVDGRGETVSLAVVQLLRGAIDGCGWKHDAIAVAIGVSAKYLSRMLAGEKAWTVRHLQALPDEVEAAFVKAYAESFGLMVVERVSDDVARQQLASGLFNMLAPRLPARADAMAKATLPTRPAKAVLR